MSVTLPRRSSGPLRQVMRRVLIASGALIAVVLLVYFDRGGYHDAAKPRLTFVDALYYATVSLSTTGYGDISPYSEHTRLINALVVTPLRVLFLIILVGTTLEVLTERTRAEMRLNRWRIALHDHIVVVGYGSKGRSVVTTLLGNGVRSERIVVVDESPQAVAEANAAGFAGVLGDATRRAVLNQAETPKARTTVIATHRDDTAALTALTARQLNAGMKIVASVRDAENAPLLRQSGADTVITSSDAAGQLLGVATLSPHVSEVVQDLLTYGSGLEIVERPTTRNEVGVSPRDCQEAVLAVLRGSRLLHYDDPGADPLESTDRLVVARTQG